MKRRTLLKTLLGIAASPSVIGEVTPKPTKEFAGTLRVNDRCRTDALTEKFGNVQYTDIFEEMGSGRIKSK